MGKREEAKNTMQTALDTTEWSYKTVENNGHADKYE